jgi:hypothetical protein
VAILAEQGCAADAFQHPLRSRFQARLTPGVGRLEEEELMSIENPSRVERFLLVWAPLLVVFITAAGGLVTWSFNSARERAQQDYQRREARYSNLVSSLRGFYTDGSPEEKAHFLNELALCWLYCSDTVIRNGYAFLATVHTGAKASNEEKNSALGRLVLSIRKDLLARVPVERTDLQPDEFKVLKPNK